MELTARQRILVIVAMGYEGDAIAGVMADTRLRDIGPYEGRVGEVGSVQAVVMVGGVGPAQAAAVTTAGVALAGPFDLVVSAGIAGAFRDRGVGPGDLVVADELVPADLGIHSEEGFAVLKSIGPRLHAAPWFVSAAQEHARAVAGPILTLSTLTGTDRRARELADKHPMAIAEAMEGVGVALTARRWGVPFAELRTISNWVGPYDRSAWTKDRAIARLAQGFRDTLLAAEG